MLLDIYKNLKSRLGFKDAERDAIIAKINDACREIWDSTDLMESRDEFIVDINVQAQTITIPWFAENVRKMRYYNGRFSIAMHNQVNRYAEDDGNEIWIRRWRVKHRSPLMRDIDNETRLTLTLPIANGEEFTVAISGETPNATRVTEIVTFGPTDIEKETVNDFIGPKITNIVKSKLTKYNLTILSANDDVLAVIPNHLYWVKFVTIQILDQPTTVVMTTYSAVEIQYKRQFEPLFNDYDEFGFGSKYDMAVLWKFLEQNKNVITDAAAAQVKCTQILDQIRENEEENVVTKLNFAPTLMNLPYNIYGLRRVN